MPTSKTYFIFHKSPLDLTHDNTVHSFMQLTLESSPPLPQTFHPAIHTKIRTHLEMVLSDILEDGRWERRETNIYWISNFHTYSAWTTNIFMQSFWGGVWMLVILSRVF